MIPIPAHNTGDLIVLVLGTDAGRSPTFVNTWTSHNTDIGSERLEVFTHTGAVTPITAETITLSTADEITVHIFVCPDGDTANPISGTVQTLYDSANTTAPQAPTVTPSHDGCLIVTACASGVNSNCLHPLGWLSAGREEGGTAVATVCSYKHQTTATATGTIDFPFGSDAPDRFSYITFAIKFNTVADEARMLNAPVDLIHAMGHQAETENIATSDLTATIPTINGKSTYFLTPATVNGNFFDQYRNGNTRVSSNTFEGRCLLLATNWPTDVDYSGMLLSVGVQHTGKSKLNDYSEISIYFGFYDDTNDAWRVWTIKGGDSIPSPKTATNIIVDVEGGWEDLDGGAGDFDVSNSITQVSHFLFGKVIEPEASNKETIWLPVYNLLTMTIVGGNSTRPGSFATCRESAITNGVNTVQNQSDQSEGQFYVTQSLSIGDGSTPTVWDSTGQSVEFPSAFDLSRVRVQSKISAGALSLFVNSSCTLEANTLNMGNYHRFDYISGTITGASLLINSTPVLNGPALTGWTLSGCKEVTYTTLSDLSGGCTIANCVDAQAITVTNETDMHKLDNCSFTNNATAIRITGNQTGIWADPNLTVSNNGFDIEYTGATDFEIQSANALTVNNSSTGTLTIATPVPTLTINGHPVGAIVLIHDLNSADPQELGTELFRDNNAAASVQYAGVAGNVVEVSMYATGYKPFSIEYTFGATDATLTIKPEVETN